MDLIRQNKLIGWVIATLVVLNVLSITLLWLGWRPTREEPAPQGARQIDGTATLLQREIGLSNQQTARFEAARLAQQERSRSLSDSLTALKLRIADEVFAPGANTRKVDSLATRIGEVQAQLELMRFGYFRELVENCDSVQRLKLYPVLREVFGRKPPKGREADEFRPSPGDNRQKPRRSDDVRPDRPAAGGSDDKPMRDRDAGDNSPKRDRHGRGDNTPPLPDEHAPPSIEEKLQRYAERLLLTPEQIAKVRTILQNGQPGRGGNQHPGESDDRRDREKVREQEDKSIMTILTPPQRAEFEKMIRNRGQQRPPRDRKP
jgi:Spy/CpxP family protein refolding chaperone